MTWSPSETVIETPQARMDRVATAFLAGLPQRALSAAMIPYADTDRRHQWSYLPRLHPGVCLASLPARSRKAAMRLLATALSPTGYARAVAIMGLEEVLDRQEDWRKGRHSQDFWVSVFGTPGGLPWGWRFEGHHLSLTMTLTADGISCTPLFLGAHPARADGVTGPVIAPLADHDQMGLDLLRSLPARLAEHALVAPQPPPDIHSGASAHFTDVIRPQGLAAEDMPEQSRAALVRLLSAYEQDLDPQVLRLAPGYRPGPDGLWFAWQGPATGTGSRYYRVQGAGVLIEHNLQIGAAGHAHSVRRVPGRDFGDTPPRPG